MKASKKLNNLSTDREYPSNYSIYKVMQHSVHCSQCSEVNACAFLMKASRKQNALSKESDYLPYYGIYKVMQHSFHFSVLISVWRECFSFARHFAFLMKASKELNTLSQESPNLSKYNLSKKHNTPFTSKNFVTFLKKMLLFWGKHMCVSQRSLSELNTLSKERGRLSNYNIHKVQQHSFHF